MVKKKLFITISALSAMCLIGACGNELESKTLMPTSKEVSSPEVQKNTEISENRKTEQQNTNISVDTSIAQTTSSDTAVLSSGNQGEQQQTTLLVTDLTQQEVPQVCIDYSIESYDILQQFSYNLFKQNIESENPVISPVSAYLALCMAGFGADGTTLKEFQNVLGDMEIYSDNLMNTLPEQSENLMISLANSTWLDNKFIADKSWLERVKSFTRAEAFQSDISSIDTMNSINNWVSKHTNGLIEQMLENPLDEDTRLALLNTIYFKAKWNTPFEQNASYTEEFRLDSDNINANAKGAEGNSTIEVPMMHQYGVHYEYIANAFAEGVILPYQSNSQIYNLPNIPASEDVERYIDSPAPNLAFIALKPINTENYQHLYEETRTDYLIGESAVRDMYGLLTNEVMADLLVNKQTKLVNLKLPKFEITFDKKLNESLKNIGLKACFDSGNANFTKMGTTTDGGNLYIDLVRQKAKIIVDEEGTEAAAATEVMIKNECASIIEEEPMNVYFDQPFLYIIMDMEKEVPLFIGIMDNPAA